jgi:hypothetical protein
MGLHGLLQEQLYLLCFWFSSVGIATGYGLDGRDFIPERCKIFFSTPQRPGRLWGSFPDGKMAET